MENILKFSQMEKSGKGKKNNNFLRLVAQSLSKESFLNRPKIEFSKEDDKMWEWIEKLSKSRLREIAVFTKNVDFVLRMAREHKHEELIYIINQEEFEVRTCSSLGWKRMDRMSAADIAFLWAYKSVNPNSILLHGKILENITKLRSILESDSQDIVSIEIMLMESSEHEKIKNKSHVKSRAISNSKSVNRNFEAMTLEAFCARLIIEKFRHVYRFRNDVPIEKVNQDIHIARAFESRMSTLSSLWDRLKDTSHSRELSIHEKLIVTNAPKRLSFSKEFDLITKLEMILTIPVLHYSNNSSAVMRWKGRLQWLANRERDILIEEEEEEEEKDSASLKSSKKANRRRKKKIRMREKNREKKKLDMIRTIVDEIMNDSIQISKRNEKRRRKLALHQKQQIVLRRKQVYLEMRSIALCMARAAMRISEKEKSKRQREQNRDTLRRISASAASVAKHAHKFALNQARFVESLLMIDDATTKVEEGIEVSSSNHDSKNHDDDLMKMKESSSNTEQLSSWASGRCNALYEWSHDRKGLRAVGTTLRNEEEEEEEEKMKTTKSDVIRRFSVGNSIRTSESNVRKERGRINRRTNQDQRAYHFEDDNDDDNLAWLLHRDILDITAAFDQIAKQRRPFQLAVVNAVRAVVNRLWPAARVEVFGSFGQGLSIPASDVDLVVCDVHEHMEEVLRKTGRQASCVQVLAELLREQDWVRNVQTLETAKVPIIKAKTFFEELGAGGVALDISFDMPAHRGLATCAFVRNLRATYPALVPLTLVLKQFLVAKGLNDPYTGGLSSYGTLLMVAAVLDKSEQMRSTMSSTRPLNLGALLIIFLRLYVEQFDPSKHGISLRRAMSTRRSDEMLIPRGGPKNMTTTTTTQEQDQKNDSGTTLGRCFFSRHRLWQMQMVEQQMKQYQNQRTTPFNRDSREMFFRNLDANSLLVIKDPFNPNNNVGRSCFGIYQVIAELQRALHAIDQFTEKMKSSKDSKLFQMRFSALGAFFSTDHHRRVVKLAEQLYKPSGVPTSSSHIHTQYSAGSTRTSSPRTSKKISMERTLSRPRSSSFDVVEEEEEAKQCESHDEDTFLGGDDRHPHTVDGVTKQVMLCDEIDETTTTTTTKLEETETDKSFDIVKRSSSEEIEKKFNAIEIKLEDVEKWNSDESKFQKVLASVIKHRREFSSIEEEELEMYSVLTSRHASSDMRIRFVRTVLFEHICPGYGEHEILLHMLETLNMCCSCNTDEIIKDEVKRNWIWKSIIKETVSLALSKFKLASEKQDSRDVKIKTRTQLKILGRWLGLVTLGRNRPLLTSTIDLKSLLYCGFTEQNSKNSSSKYFLPAVPFVSKVITSAAADSIVFRIPNPWTVAILRVLQKIYHDSSTPLSLKFEIEVLFHQMQSDINTYDEKSYPPFHWNQLRSQKLVGTVEDHDEAMVRRIVDHVRGKSSPSTSTAIIMSKQSPSSLDVGGWDERVQRWAIACWKQLCLMQQGTPAFPHGCAGCGVGHHTAHTPNCPVSTLILSFPSHPS